MFGRLKAKLEELPDYNLVRKVKNGDREAYGKLYLKYLDGIYRYVYFRMGQEKETAEDLTEVVFFKAWEHIGQFQEEGGTFQSWLYRIAHNTIIDHIRKNGRLVEMSEEMADGRKSVEEKVIEKIEAERLKETLKCLNDDQREVIVMKYIEGISNREIARTLNKNEDSIRQIQHRALLKLREKLS